MRPSIRHFISAVHFTVACVGAFPRAEHGALSILLVESVVCFGGWVCDICGGAGGPKGGCCGIRGFGMLKSIVESGGAGFSVEDVLVRG